MLRRAFGLVVVTAVAVAVVGIVLAAYLVYVWLSVGSQ